MEVLSCQSNPTCMCDKCGASLRYDMSDVKAKFLNHVSGRKSMRKVVKYVTCPVCNNEIWLSFGK